MVQTINYIKGRFVTGAVPTQADFADLVDTLIAVATCKTPTWTIAVSPTGGTQKGTGNLLQDNVLIGATPLEVMTVDNVPLQWETAGVTFDAGTGTFDFSTLLSEGVTQFLSAGKVITIPYLKSIS